MTRSKPFSPKLDEAELRELSNLALAHMGDAVYEVLVRTWLCTHGRMTSRDLHRETVGFVSAPAQARAAIRRLRTSSATFWILRPAWLRRFRPRKAPSCRIFPENGVFISGQADDRKKPA